MAVVGSIRLVNGSARLPACPPLNQFRAASHCLWHLLPCFIGVAQSADRGYTVQHNTLLTLPAEPNLALTNTDTNSSILGGILGRTKHRMAITCGSLSGRQQPFGHHHSIPLPLNCLYDRGTVSLSASRLKSSTLSLSRSFCVASSNSTQFSPSSAVCVAFGNYYTTVFLFYPLSSFLKHSLILLKATSLYLFVSTMKYFYLH